VVGGSASAGAAGATEESSNDVGRLVAQGERLLEKGKTDQARKLYDKALQLQPDSRQALTGLAYCDLDRERYLSAIDRFKKVLALYANDGEALIGVAEAYKMQGLRAQALEYYRRYVQVWPVGPKVLMAQNNIRDLEAKEQRTAGGRGSGETSPPPDDPGAPSGSEPSGGTPPN
jgi:tetratricopeptide (TPR) repeat protein